MCKNHDYGHIVMPWERKNILKYNQNKKSVKISLNIYPNTESQLNESQN